MGWKGMGGIGLSVVGISEVLLGIYEMNLVSVFETLHPLYYTRFVCFHALAPSTS